MENGLVAENGLATLDMKSSILIFCLKFEMDQLICLAFLKSK